MFPLTVTLIATETSSGHGTFRSTVILRNPFPDRSLGETTSLWDFGPSTRVLNRVMVVIVDDSERKIPSFPDSPDLGSSDFMYVLELTYIHPHM